MSEVDFCNGKFSPWFSLKIFCWKGIAFKSLPYEKWLCSAGCSPMTERFPENLFASSVFSLAKRKRRNEKESSFLKDLAGIPKTGIFGFDSHSSRIVFLLHHLDKKLKMWDTFFFEKKKKTQPRKNRQPTPVWLEMAFCCPKPLVEQQIAASHAALARILLRLRPRSLPAAGASRPTVLQISPILSPATSGACPCPLPHSSSSPSLLQVTTPARGSQSQFGGHSPSSQVYNPSSRCCCL